MPADPLIAQMVPPPTFDEVSFDSYIPDPNEPSQAAPWARRGTSPTGREVHAAAGKKSLFGKKKQVQGAGLYLDGGFGVGKTHLLASIYHASPVPRSFGTFGEVTSLVGALGFTNAVERLAGKARCASTSSAGRSGRYALVSRLLTELTARGVSWRRPPRRPVLGEGRFAAQDFLREIKKLGSLFEAVRVDGPDYRHRDLPPAPEPTAPELLAEKAAATPNSTLDDFDALLQHLSTLHPSRFGALIDG